MDGLADDVKDAGLAAGLGCEGGAVIDAEGAGAGEGGDLNGGVVVVKSGSTRLPVV